MEPENFLPLSGSLTDVAVGVPNPMELDYAMAPNLEKSSEETFDDKQKESYWAIIEKVRGLLSVTEVATIQGFPFKLIALSLLFSTR